ncbi:MAG: zinc ribbon domain-containing protein [Euryarchaeota archaeon]|nr:zinc ribbon domain-containing protein [Euryarchaeota archaeon]MDE1834996.1 zinc ribbon domain-containing protein [Euryarchaeota archaeon]MDE1880663.1 zinc ribbon domain-containing protein [Euryarchaeota archaeon]MDE2044835.1 zinc ribbon domain-containing protein [Thermoplasmata archaeon]
MRLQEVRFMVPVPPPEEPRPTDPEPEGGEGTPPTNGKGEGNGEEFAPDESVNELAAQLEGLLEEATPELPTVEEPGAHPDTEALVGEVLGEERFVGDESLCPACGAVTSVYADRCARCGAAFDPESCKCAHCSALVPAEALFCPHCKQPLTNPEALCPTCSSPVPFHASSCPTCGAELEVGEMRCASCDAPVEPDAISCTNCGALLIEGAKKRSEALAQAGSGGGGMAGVQVGQLRATLEGGTGVTEVEVESRIENKVQVEAILKQPEVSPTTIQAQAVAAAHAEESKKAKREEARSKLMGAKGRKATALFPFSGVLGQEKMKLALLCNIVDPLVGGVLISGQKGTAKSVTVRGLTEITPEIKIVEGCRFSCDPARPQEWCWECTEKYQGRTPDAIPTRVRPLKVVDLPLNATEDRVVGTLDVSRMLTEGEVAFEHGVLAEANRGILYVDEINLLDDYVVDVLLDAAAMGRVTVEREGISVSYPARFVMVGTMNPEEGSLRPQLLDRIALQVSIVGIEDLNTRMEIVRRRQDFERDSADFRARFEPLQGQIREKIKRSREILPKVEISQKLFAAIPKVTTAFGVDGHRADIMIERGARSLCALEGRTQVSADDVGRIAEMALPHRMRRKPFEQAEFSPERLRRVIEENL